MRHYKLEEIPEEWVTPVFARKFFTGEQITLAFITLKEGCTVPEHSHDSEQFSYLASGAMRFKIGDDELTVSAGEVVHIPSWVPHSAVAIVDTTGIDVFSPIRKDWLDGSDDYLRR
ncbi:MAG: cupin domain-containing protein [Acidobacteriota bacterium]